jgi:hypothetical protein
MAGIQNILDVVDLVEVVAADIKAAKADGSINLFDIPKFADVLPALNAAVDGSDQIPAEFKDLDGDEGKVILLRMVGALTEMAEVFVGGETPDSVKAILQKGIELVTTVMKAWVSK